MESSAIIKGIHKVTGKWCKQRKREERVASARLNRASAMTRHRAMFIKDAAWLVMEQAYMKASSNGTLPAHARQIMYAARGEILQLAEQDCLKDNYFTQTLLPGYIDTHPEAQSWDVVYDARGHFSEPHASKGEIVPLGTIDVRRYLGKAQGHTVSEPEARVSDGDTYPTCGPENRFGAIMFIEKEGFLPLFERVQLAEKYDLAIMSTKGVSNVASRRLVDELCGEHGLPLLVVHDFDVDGFKILGSLHRSTRRYRFAHDINVIDLGLRLEDVQHYELESESVFRTRDLDGVASKNGATPEEIEFMRNERVELNAFGSAELIEWLESKLEEHGIAKVVPDEETLAAAYRRFVEVRHLENAIDRISKDAREQAQDVEVPEDLESEIRECIEEDPALSWDKALSRLVTEEDEERHTEPSAK